MLVKNKLPAAKTYRESSAQRSTFLKENNSIQRTTQFHTNSALKPKIADPIYSKCALLPTKHIQVIINPMPAPAIKSMRNQRRVEFDDERYVSYIPFESHYDNSPAKVEALNKLYNTEGLDYTKLPITKQDMLLEKEIGVIVMMNLINSENMEEKTDTKLIESLNAEERKEPPVEENKYQFSTQWVDEWDMVTSKQKNIVYKQIVEIRKRATVTEASTAKSYSSQQSVKFPAHKKQLTFLVSDQKTLLSDGAKSKETKGKRIVQHLLAHYQKYKSARCECK